MLACATRIRARHVLLPEGWRRDATVAFGADGRITGIESAGASADVGVGVGVLLPAPANLHSHTFQRAMAGLTEHRTSERDSFWTWRTLMYRFLETLSPDDVEAIASLAFVEMLESGFAAVGEFHYLHNAPDGFAYDDPAELSLRIAAAAAATGIGLALLPVLYTQGGLDGRALSGGQRRFGLSRDAFAAIVERAEGACRELADSGLPDAAVGVAPHSLRAVSADELDFCVGLRPDAPLHLHAAEQVAEVDEVIAATGHRPVEWLLGAHAVDARWCLVHATQMTGSEAHNLAATGATVALCPETEANLGDGIMPLRVYREGAGRFGVGTDSNVRIGLADELRALEYAQRLGERERVVVADADRSAGRTLWEAASAASRFALRRDAGEIARGRLADLVALDDADLVLADLQGDRFLDAFVFAGGARPTDVWTAGRHVVREGRHVAREGVEARARPVLRRLRADL